MRQPVFSLALAFFALTVALQLPVPLAADSLTLSANAGKDLVLQTGESTTVTCTSDNSKDLPIWLGPGMRAIEPVRAEWATQTSQRIHSRYQSATEPNIPQLVLGNLTKADSGSYGCVSTGDYHPFKDQAIQKSLSIHFNLHVFHPTELTGTRHFTVAAGRPQTLECIVTSDADVHLEITWLYQGRDFSTVHLSKYRIDTSPPWDVTHTSGLVRTVTRLIFPRVHKEDEGEYSCSVNSTNAYLANQEEFQVYLKVVSKPRFPANTPDTIWIDEETALGCTQNSTMVHVLTLNEPESVQASLEPESVKVFFEVDGNSSPSLPLCWMTMFTLLFTRIVFIN